MPLNHPLHCDLLTELERVESLFAEREHEVLSFVPEIGRFERLNLEARALLERYPEPTERPALFGVLVGVKDALHVDGFPTLAGSRLPAAVLQGAEGPCVAALRAAGALILGKTVTTEFTYFAPGPTRNPHHPEHTPGGSSSGSAAAVGAGLAQVALGTQTIGSITRPAAFCGVVGFKASYDRVSRAGSIPLAPSLDHIGVLAASLAEVRRMAPVMIEDWRPAGTGTSIASAERPVLGIPDGSYLEQAEPAGLRHFRETCQRLEQAGFEIRSVSTMEDFEDVKERHNRIVAAECARVHARWFPRYGDLYREKTAELIRRGQKVSDEDLARALKGRKILRQKLMDQMNEHRLDLWLSPSAPGPAPRGLDWTGDPVMSLPWTYSGLPTVGLPSGKSSAGLPLGLQVAGRWQADETLLDFADRIERVLE